jgi:hypothetical protein
VYTLSLASFSWRGFREGLFVVVWEGRFVGGVRIRVSMSVAYKALARSYRRV